MTSEEEIVQRYLYSDGSLRQMSARRGPRLLVLERSPGVYRRHAVHASGESSTGS